MRLCFSCNLLAAETQRKHPLDLQLASHHLSAHLTPFAFGQWLNRILPTDKATLVKVVRWVIQIRRGDGFQRIGKVDLPVFCESGESSAAIPDGVWYTHPSVYGLD